MKKVGIILYLNMRFAPYVKVYTDILDEMLDVTYELIYLDRIETLNEIKDETHIPIKWNSVLGKKQSVLAKVFNNLLYPYRAIKILKKKEYDFLIVLTTMPAVLLKNYLIKQYTGKYIVDIRDYTKEHYKWFYKAEKEVMRNSALNVISSPGFKDFLPPESVSILHNFNKPGNEMYVPLSEKRNSNTIRISYIGSIQYETQCKYLIDLVKEDQRFEFYFYGNEPVDHTISDYVATVNCERIKMMGIFLPEEKNKIYNESDLVFNCYGNDSLLVQKAISNKYYDGAIFQRPLLVSPNTLMQNLAGKFAFSMDLENMKSLDAVWNWYQKLDETSFTVYCDSVIEIAQKENDETAKKINQAICSVKEIK